MHHLHGISPRQAPEKAKHCRTLLKQGVLQLQLQALALQDALSLVLCLSD